MTNRRLTRAALATLLLAAAAVHAQTPAPPISVYGDAVRHYVATGDAAAAAAVLRDWTRERFEAALEAYIAVGEGNVLAPAAVLQLEIALGVVGQAPAVAQGSLQLGERFLRRIPNPPSPAGAAFDRTEFAARWYAAAASVFLLVNDPNRAAPFVGHGLLISPASPELRLLDGVLTEVQALAADPTFAPRSQRVRISRERKDLLVLAHAKYKRLVDEHPSFTRARVRLGRVRWLLDDAGGAESQLIRARAEAREPAQLYLAAMFLGAIYDQRGDSASARVAYEQALAAAPASQSAAVALGFLDVMAGRPDRAQVRAIAVLSRTPAADEWWAYKNGGVDWESVNWLRRAVRP
jgi:tetratricopeptide (TPR) repeat protein